MRIAAIQLDIVWEEKRANFEKVRALLARTPPEPGALVILPEMFSTGFSMNLARTQQGPQREDEMFLANLAREYRVWVAAGVVNAADGGLGRNEAVIFDQDGKEAARYAKIHPFSLGGESLRHQAGTKMVTFGWAGFGVAPFICYDLRFPEIFRDAARRGANLFVVMALWPVKRQQHWLTLLQARAIENQAYVIGVNRVGQEPDYSYAGRSVIIDPHGVIIADAGEREQVLGAALDLEVVNSWRKEFPALRDARWPIADSAQGR